MRTLAFPLALALLLLCPLGCKAKKTVPDITPGITVSAPKKVKAKEIIVLHADLKNVQGLDPKVIWHTTKGTITPDSDTRNAAFAAPDFETVAVITAQLMSTNAVLDTKSINIKITK